MCREEALGLSSLRPELDSRGVALCAVVHQPRGAEQFKPFIKGDVFLDRQKIFYGPKERWMPFTGLLRFGVWKNIYRAYKTGVDGNFEGEGRLLGGVFVIGPGDQGVLFQHQESEFGDHANIQEVLNAVKQIS